MKKTYGENKIQLTERNDRELENSIRKSTFNIMN